MKDFTALTADAPRRLSTENVAFDPSTIAEHSGKVSPRRKVAPIASALFKREQALSSFTDREDVYDDGPGLRSPSDSSLLLQLLISVALTKSFPAAHQRPAHDVLSHKSASARSHDIHQEPAACCITAQEHDYVLWFDATAIAAAAATPAGRAGVKQAMEQSLRWEQKPGEKK